MKTLSMALFTLPLLLLSGSAQARMVCYQGRCYDPTPREVVEASPTQAERLKQTVAEIGPEAFTAPDYKRGLVRHIVLFRYDPRVTAEQKTEVKRRFLSLKSETKREGRPYIVSIETGAQSSGEGVDQSLEQAFIVTFRSEGDRNHYVGSPIVTDARYYDAAHQAFKDFVGPLLHKPVNPSGVLVFDFRVEARR